MVIYFLIMALLLALDQGSKIWVRAEIPEGHLQQVFLPNFLELTHAQNKGVSFSIMSDLPDVLRVPLLSGISLIAVIAMLYYFIRYRLTLDNWMKWALVCIIPGALGNLIDRVLYHAVTDFLHFRWYETSFFVNNLADCFISLGVVFFALSAFFEQRHPASTNEKSSSQA